MNEEMKWLPNEWPWRDRKTGDDKRWWGKRWLKREWATSEEIRGRVESCPCWMSWLYICERDR